MEKSDFDRQNDEKKILDLEKLDDENELKDLDVGDFFVVNKKLKVSNTNKKLIDTISKLTKKTINLSLFPKIRIYKKSIKNKEDIHKKTKKQILNLSDFKRVKDLDTINFRQESELKELSIYEQHFDIYNPPRPISYYIIKKTKKNKNNITKFAIYAFVFIFSVFSYKTIVLYLVESAYKNIYSLTDSKNIGEISKNINNSRFEFLRASYLFAPIDLFFNNSHFSYAPVRNLSNLIEGGKSLSKGLDKSMYIYDSLLSLIEQKGAENIYYTEFLVDAKPSVEEISGDIDEAINIYKNVDDLGSEQLNNSFYKAYTKLNEFSIDIKTILKNYDSLLDILAYKKEKKYLVVFQNSDEIRATGGFMGSMGVLSIFKGKVKDFDKKDVYAYEWKIKPYREDPPEGISKITDSFGLRDSNYFIDFRDSSEKIKFFMKKAGVNLDGIIYLNNNIITDYLNLIGAVHFAKINKDIDSSNFNFIMSSLVESKIFKQGSLDTPKRVLFDFMLEFYNKLKKEAKYKEYSKIFFDDIKRRDIVFFTFLSRNNEFLDKYDLIGRLDYDAYVDFVYPVFTSISGNKSDRYVKRKFIKETKILSNCMVENKLTINQTHLFSPADEINHISFFNEFGITDYKDLLNIQGKGTNKQFVRIVLPKNAKLLTKGLDLEKETNYNVVSFYTEVDPGKTVSNTIEYEIENKSCQDYDFKFYKQSGLRNYDLDLEGVEQKNLTDLNDDFSFTKD